MTQSSFFRAALVACGITGLTVPLACNAREAPVARLIDAAIAGNPTQVDQAMLQLRSQPKPPRGDHRLARELNERGLALWQRQRYAEAAALFSQAQAADPSDAEIADNLGYALVKAGQVTSAERAILDALTLAPERASAWGTLGLIYAKQGKHRDAVACVLTAYRFSRDKKRTLDVYSRLAEIDDDSRVRALMSDVVARLSITRAAAEGS